MEIRRDRYLERLIAHKGNGRVKIVTGIRRCGKSYTGDVQNIFPQCEKISIDFAVMEPAAADGRVYTHPADFGWSDLGNWASLHDKLAKDADHNGAVGNVKLYECRNCVVHAEDARKVVLQGLDGYIVSEKNGQILICKRSEEQRIRDFSAE